MDKVIGNLKQGLLFVLSAPAGTGKTTLVNKLVDEFPCIVRSVSFTTRQPRRGEINGVDYHFVTKEQFLTRQAEGDFLEHAKIYDDLYGTSKSSVEKQLKSGKHVVLVIDTQGAKQIKEKANAVFIFVKPPNLDELKARLEKRQTESDEVIKERLLWADREIAESKNYNYCITNDCFETAYRVLKSIFIAEEHRVSRVNT